MHFTVIRRMDKLGRIVLPVDMRRFFGFVPGCPLRLKTADNDIVLTKADSPAADRAVMDTVGRIVIPIALRRQFRMDRRIALAVLPMEDGIHLRPVSEG